MMREKDAIQNQIIDEYYDDAPKSCPEIDNVFAGDMKMALAKMEVIKDLDFPLDINLLDIIAKGENIKKKRKIKIEAAGFIVVCLLITSILGVLILNTDLKVYLYIQAALSAVLPLSVIPIAKNYRGEA